MKTRTIYIADDGTEFESKKACEYYTKGIKGGTGVIFFDADLNVLCTSDSYSYEEIAELVAYIRVDSEEGINYLKWFSDYTELNIPKVCKDNIGQIYAWDNDKDEWINLTEEYTLMGNLIRDIKEYTY